MLALLPLLLGLISYASWVVFYIRKKITMEQLKNRAISTLVILLFLCHPNIVQYMFNTFK